MLKHLASKPASRPSRYRTGTAGSKISALALPPTSGMPRGRSFTPALLLSVILHALLLLGLGLTIALPRVRPDLTSTLDVVLLHRPSTESPKRADYLADANQTGAIPEQKEQAMPAPETPPPPPAAASMEKEQPASPEPAREKPPPKPAAAVRPNPKHPPKPRPASPAAAPQEEPSPLPSAAQLINNGLQMASIASAPDRASALAHDHLPREKFVSARTREHKYAAYMDAWRIKVEAIGNLNYPEEARRQGMTGELVLDVALKQDGSVKYMTVLRSSGSSILDEAALRIVRLAAPFAPFPEAIKSETDFLHIIRTWRFERGNRLTSAR